MPEDVTNASATSNLERMKWFLTRYHTLSVCFQFSNMQYERHKRKEKNLNIVAVVNGNTAGHY
jgi:hypothetical protein